VSCSTVSFVCISHLPDDAYLFHKKAGARAGKPGSRSGNG